MLLLLYIPYIYLAYLIPISILIPLPHRIHTCLNNPNNLLFFLLFSLTSYLIFPLSNKFDTLSYCSLSTILIKLIHNLCTIVHWLPHEDLDECVGSSIWCNALLLSHTHRMFRSSNYKIHSASLLLRSHLVPPNLLYNLSIIVFFYHLNHEKHACFTRGIYHICLVSPYRYIYTFHITKIIFFSFSFINQWYFAILLIRNKMGSNKYKIFVHQ